MPISITFFAGQGEEPTLIKVGTAYEAATHHRFAPPMLPPLKAAFGVESESLGGCTTAWTFQLERSSPCVTAG